MNASQRRVSDALDALTVAVEDETLPSGVVWSLGYLRAWMEGRIVSDRQTGATLEQIEAAKKRAVDAWGFGEGMPPVLGTEVLMAAPFLVPPTHRIVAEDDLRAVLGLAAAFVNEYGDGGGEDAAIERLREVLGE